MPPKRTPPSAPESPDIATLAEVVAGLTQQVRQLALILDEVREDLVWAVRNDKFHAAGHSERFVATMLPERQPNPEAENDAAPRPPDAPPPRSGTLFD